MRLNLRWLGVIVALLILGAGSWWLGLANADQSLTVPSLANTETIFEEILPELRQNQIPLRLPTTYIPSRGQWNSDEEIPPIYANLELSDSSGYSVILGYTQDCNGSSACRLGSVSGQMQPTDSPERAYTDEDYLYPRRSEEPLTAVSLSKGIQGVFLPWRCAASCTDSQIVWSEDGYQYSVGIKLGDLASLVEMANSAIEYQEDN